MEIPSYFAVMEQATTRLHLAGVLDVSRATLT